MKDDRKTNKRRLPALLRWILWVLLVQFILINVSSAFYAYRLTHFYTGEAPSDQKEGNIFSKTWRLFSGPRQWKTMPAEKPLFPYQTIQLKTARGLVLEGWYSHIDSAAKGSVALFHGITSNKSVLLEEAYEFHTRGYHVLLIDLRGHGNSEGQTSTVGVREAEEVKLAYEFLKGKQSENIFLYGSSMGSVIITKAVADYGLTPTGVILDMPFESLQSYLKNKARVLGFPRQPFAFLTTFWIGVERGFNGFKHKTTAYAQKLNCPVLMQWGGRDQFILKPETERVFESIASSSKKLVIYEQAPHASFLINDPLKWRIEIERFLQTAGK